MSETVHIPDGYAPEEVEKELHLPLKRQSKDGLLTVEKTLRIIADFLGRDAPEVAFPRKGLLIRTLTDRQRKELNAILTPQYARRNADQQKELLSVRIQETGEKMYDLESLLTRHRVGVVFSDRPFEDACGSWAGMKRIWWLRREVCDHISKLFSSLNEVGITPRVEDAWRHEIVQEGLFIRRLVALAREYPRWDAGTVHTVAMSFTASRPGLAGHQAGAAIDWRMMTRDAESFLDLGNDYPEGGAVSSLDFPYLTKAQWETRTLFAGVNALSGFRMLTTENWHSSRKDRGMSMGGGVTMQTAYYGPINDFDRETGEVVPYRTEDVDTLFLGESEAGILIEESRKVVLSRGGKFKHTLAGLIGILRSIRRKKWQ